MKKKSEQKKVPLVSNSRGIALVLVLIVLILMTSLGLSVASTTTIEVQIASRSEEVSKGFYYAEAGLNMAVSMVKQMRGDFNDLLAGPDATTFGVTFGLATHRDELVIGSGGWSSTSTSPLPASNQSGPMFPSTVKGFTRNIASSPNLDDIQQQLMASGFGTAKIVGDNAKWAGKITFPDSVTNSKYEVSVEVYDDDDSYSRLFNAHPNGSGYPSTYSGNPAPVYKIPGPDTTSSAYNSFDNCDKEFVECPGSNSSKFGSFSGVNKDFNARVLVRSTARQIKTVGSTQTIVSEVTVDSIVGFFPYPAVITEGCTVMSGSSKILGSYGGIHANDGLCLTGSPTVEQSATSATPICESCPSSPSSDCTGGGGGGIKVCGFSGGNQPILIVPDLNPLRGTGDIAPPDPQTSNSFWLTQVQDRNANARSTSANKVGADIIFLSRKTATGSQRTRLHGTSSTAAEDGLLMILTNMTEDQFLTWRNNLDSGNKPNVSDAIVIDRSSGVTKIASMANNGDLSDWYRLSGSDDPVSGLADVGWEPGTSSSGGGGGGGGGSSTSCANSTNCPPPNPPAGTPSRASNGDLFSNDSSLDTSALRNKVYFFDGDVKVTNNPGTDANPVSLTIITTGYIDVQGTPNFVGQLKAKLDPIAPPFTNPQLLFLAGTDVALQGNLTTSIKFEGVVYAREQVGLTGNCTYTGQVVAADITGFDNKVSQNLLSGSASVTFKGSTGALGAVRSSSYRVLKF
ncbi:MAG: hypothetical protein HY819_04935 [Acidobacteria bacterium]|nr:hypothetical protein [Acidobacteriota bacterium]